MKTSLLALARNHLELANAAKSGRAVTVQVLLGRVRLTTGADELEAVPGDLLTMPKQPHRVEALEDSVFLFTTALRL